MKRIVLYCRDDGIMALRDTFDIHPYPVNCPTCGKPIRSNTIDGDDPTDKGMQNDSWDENVPTHSTRGPAYLT